MNRIKIIVLLILLSTVSVNAQNNFLMYVSPMMHTDTTLVSGKRHWLKTSTSIVGLNLGVWAFDRFIIHGDYSYINTKTIKKNIKYGFMWDNDKIETNMFMHPYHGSLYYNAARSNGYNYWQSSLFSLGGSLMWEMFMECEYPSSNDLLATTIGGTALGEVCYRISDLILDDRATGTKRFGRELGAFLISPMRGLTRIINGNAWKTRNTSGKSFNSPEIRLNIGSGINMTKTLKPKGGYLMGGTINLSMEYGDLFMPTSYTPYDYFYLKMRLNIQHSQPFLGHFCVTGLLKGKELFSRKGHEISGGLYQYFDYYNSDTLSCKPTLIPYRLCIPASFGLGLKYMNTRAKRWYWEIHSHINGVLLSGIPSDHYYADERDYNMASGYGIRNAIFAYDKKKRISLSAVYKFNHLFTWKGYPKNIDWNNVNPKTLNVLGDKSKTFSHIFNFNMNVKLKKNLFLTTSCTLYSRKTIYRDYPCVHARSSDISMLLSYAF